MNNNKNNNKKYGYMYIHIAIVKNIYNPYINDFLTKKGGNLLFYGYKI